MPGDTYLLPRSPSYLRACDEAPRRLRIGLLVRPVISETASVSPECTAAAEETAGWLETMGHEVAPAPVAFPPERWAAFQALWTTGAAGVPHYAQIEKRMQNGWKTEPYALAGWAAAEGELLRHRE